MSTTDFPTSANDWGHRPHLDGLRALAVYVVVLFHARLGTFEGGFIGVDLFFVLSGFLVTNVILTDKVQFGRLRFARFYARRARRLIPAAALAIAATSLGALLVAPPLDRLAMVDDTRAASLWYANWHFIAEARDYFAADDAESPFLHFWSLAIEEQFYLVFPLVLTGLWLASRSRFKVLIGASASLLLGGVMWQVAVARGDANRAYLATDTRLYQLLAGVVLALVLWRYRLPQRGTTAARAAAPSLVLALVVTSTSLVGVSVSNRGLLAALWSVAIILAFEVARGGWAAAALSWKPIRYLGNISYGTYLWHWPVVVLIERVADVEPWALFVLSAGLGTACAALSHELIESPIRRSRGLDERDGQAIIGGVAIAVIGGLVVAPVLLRREEPPAVRVDRGIEQVVVPEARSPLLASIDDPVPDLDWVEVDEDRGRGRPCEEPDGSDCMLVEGDAGTVLLLGDSHARMFSPAWMDLAEKYGFSLHITSRGSCPWPDGAFLGATDWERAQRCIERHELVYGSQIEAIDPDLIVMASNGNRIRENLVLNSSRPDITGESHQDLLEQLVRTTVSELREEGYPLVLMEPVTIVADNPVACLSGAQVQSECVQGADDETFEEPIYREVAAADDEVWSVNLDPFLCDESGICPPIIGGVVVRRDNSHLTATYSAALADEIDEQVQVPWLALQSE